MTLYSLLGPKLFCPCTSSTEMEPWTSAPSLCLWNEWSPSMVDWRSKNMNFGMRNYSVSANAFIFTLVAWNSAFYLVPKSLLVPGLASFLKPLDGLITQLFFTLLAPIISNRKHLILTMNSSSLSKPKYYSMRILNLITALWSSMSRHLEVSSIHISLIWLKMCIEKSKPHLRWKIISRNKHFQTFIFSFIQ